MIYLDSAATSLRRPDCVAQAVLQAMNAAGNCGRSAHEAGLAAGRIVWEARERIASLFGAPSAERVAFTLNATMALNTAIKGMLRPGDRVVTTVMEHNSVLRPLYEAERQGARLQWIGCDASGNLDMDAMLQAIASRPRAVVCTHASNLTGNGVDIAAIGRCCRAYEVSLIVDASQTAGALPIDMRRDGIDVLCFTGHKSLMGPQGTGGLCLSERVSLAPLVSGGTGTHTESHVQPADMPEALEAGTLNVHGIAGLSAAVQYIAENGRETLHARATQTASRFYEGVRKIPGVRCYGDFSDWQNRAAIVSLNLGDEDSGAVADMLASEWGIAVRSGGHCAPLMHRHFGTHRQGMVRFSFSPFNTPEEADAAIRALAMY